MHFASIFAFMSRHYKFHEFFLRRADIAGVGAVPAGSRQDGRRAGSACQYCTVQQEGASNRQAHPITAGGLANLVWW